MAIGFNKTLDTSSWVARARGPPSCTHRWSWSALNWASKGSHGTQVAHFCTRSCGLRCLASALQGLHVCPI